MKAVVVAALLAGAPSAERDVAIWTTPLAVLETFAVMGLQNLGSHHWVGTPIFVPVGVGFRAAGVDWSIDAALFTASATFSNPGFAGVWFGGGPMFHRGDPGLRGFFVSPRIVFGTFRYNAWDATSAFDGVTSLAFLIGLDVGWQKVIGPVYFATTFGISGGVGLGDSDWFAGPWLADPGQKIDPGPRPVLGLNLQFVRVGYAF